MLISLKRILLVIFLKRIIKILLILCAFLSLKTSLHTESQIFTARALLLFAVATHFPTVLCNIVALSYLTCEAIKRRKEMYHFFLSRFFRRNSYASRKRRWNNRIMTRREFTQRWRNGENEAIEMSIQFGFVGCA